MVGVGVGWLQHQLSVGCNVNCRLAGRWAAHLWLTNPRVALTDAAWMAGVW
jgi:hypothetical protein